METAVVLFTRDVRVHDTPALAHTRLGLGERAQVDAPEEREGDALTSPVRPDEPRGEVAHLREIAAAEHERAPASVEGTSGRRKLVHCSARLRERARAR